MLSTAPYQVGMFTATSAEAGALTVTSKLYWAGLGAVIRYCAEDRPADSFNVAACGRSTAVRVFAPGLCVLWPFPSSHALIPAATTPQSMIAAKRLVMPQLSAMATAGIGGRNAAKGLVTISDRAANR